MKKIDTFSSNSLKILDKNIDEFYEKYVYNLSLFKKESRTILGQKFHNLICFYLKNFNITNLLKELDSVERNIWNNLENYLKEIKENFIKTEYSFLIKEKLNDKFYYLTGRFDAIYKENENYIIYDWKTLNLPKNPNEDLQTIVYLFCLNKIFNTTKIKMRYLSIERLDFIDIEFENLEKYKTRIDCIVEKYYKNFYNS